VESDGPPALALTPRFTRLTGCPRATPADAPATATSPAAYAYDAQGRVTQMTPGTSSSLDYAYDPSGNLTTLPTGATANYDNAGELTSSTLSSITTSYGYDAAGNRTSATAGSTSAATATYDGAQQLSSYADPAATMSTATYDGNGLRATATTTPAGGTSSTEHFLWDETGTVPRLLMDSTNAYVYGPSGTPVEQVDLATGATTYLIADALGSVRDAVAADGSVIASTSYDAWGNAFTAGGRHPAGELNPSVTFSITADGRPFSGLQVTLTA